MELLHGIDLGLLEARDGVVALARALDIALEVCRGVGAAHQAGVIHRDLKNHA
jgi:serine/threonine-protein kinase